MPSFRCLRVRLVAFGGGALVAATAGAGPVAVIALVFAAAAIPAAVAISGGVPQVRALCGLRDTERSKERT